MVHSEAILEEVLGNFEIVANLKMQFSKSNFGAHLFDLHRMNFPGQFFDRLYSAGFYLMVQIEESVCYILLRYELFLV